MAEQPTLVQQPTSYDDTKTPIKLAEEGDKLFENRKFKAAAEKYQEVVNMAYFNTPDESTNTASIYALYKLANMIYDNVGHIRNSGDGYTFADAEQLYDMLHTYDTKGILLSDVVYNRLKEHLENMRKMTKASVKSGGYKKRKSNRKRPSKRTRKHKWSLKYKRSIDCNHPKGFSQRQHCKYGRKNMRKLTRKK